MSGLRKLGFGALLAAALSSTWAALAMSGGHPWAAIGPAAALALALAVAHASPRRLGLSLLALAVAVESPQDLPAAGLWQSPLFPLGRLLYDNLGKTFGVGPPVSLMDLLIGVFFLSALARRGAPRAACLDRALALFAVALGALLAWGLARGGDAHGAYWQVRQLALFPLLAFGLHASLRREDLPTLGKVLVGAACLKVLLGAWFHFAVARPRGLEPEYVTTHADTVLFVGAALLLAFRWMEERSSRSARWMALLLPWIGLGVTLNDRRLAYVGLVAGLGGVLAFVATGRARRVALRMGLVLAPLVALYVAFGVGSSAAFFRPLRALSSVAQRGDSSTRARDVENWNLARTLESSPVLGVGLGQGYREDVKGDDISHAFALYRFVPHNGVLWLLAAGGVPGLLALWGPLLVGVFLAARSYRVARAPQDRVAALSCMALATLFALQAWGDMGTQSWSSVSLLAAAIASSARLAVAVGAWPAKSAIPSHPRASHLIVSEGAFP